MKKLSHKEMTPINSGWCYGHDRRVYSTDPL